MIARSLLLFVLLIVVPDVFLYRIFLRRNTDTWGKTGWWLTSVLMLAYTLFLAFSPHFIPDNPWLLFIYLLLLGVFILPKTVFALGIALGMVFGRRKRGTVAERKRLALPLASHGYGKWISAIAALTVGVLVLYGVAIGNFQFEKQQLRLSFRQLPPAFDGYRIVLFSDAHVGSFVTGKGRRFLSDVIDSINAQKPDVILFAGDLQNARPSEIREFRDVLSRLHAPDGVYAVLGNHDYANYVDIPPKEKERQEDTTVEEIRRLGWTLLCNENRVIRRGTETIALAGMENLGDPPSPCEGDVVKATEGIPEGAFTILLEHEPGAWRKQILPLSEAQLTLSGHTHGGQVSLLGISPSIAFKREWNGLYREGDRALFVTKGIGGLIPFRIGVDSEIVVITLQHE